MSRMVSCALVALGLCPLAVSTLLARQTSTLTVSAKNSPVYAQPTPVPVQSALLVVTPFWGGVAYKTPTGGRELPNQTLFMSELAVVLSTRQADCATVFALAPPESDRDFLIVAGKTEAYLPRHEWKSTSVGKVFSDPGRQKVRFPVERFSVTIQGAWLKKKSVVKDGLSGSSRLVLDQNNGQWTVDLALKADDVTAEGTLPLKACEIEKRSKDDVAPLLGDARMTSAMRSF